MFCLVPFTQLLLFLFMISDWTEVVVALKRIGAVALPTCLTYVISNTIYITNMSVMGRLYDKAALAGLSLGVTVYNVAALSASYGLLGAMDTLCANAYGAKSYGKVGLVLQRAVLVMTCVCLLMLAPMLLAPHALVALGQNPEEAAMAGVYIRWLLPGLWPSLVYDALRRYLQAQGVTVPQLICSSLIALTNLAGQLIAANYFHHYGLAGSALATSIAQTVGAVSVLLFVVWRARAKIGERTWEGFSSAAFESWGAFLRLAIPAMLLTCSEWWVWEVSKYGCVNGVYFLLCFVCLCSCACTNTRMRFFFSILSSHFIYFACR